MCKNSKSTIVSSRSEVMECLTYVKNLLVGVGFDFGTCNVNNIPIEIVSAKKIAEIRKAQISTNNKGVTFTETQMRGTFHDNMKVVGHSHKFTCSTSFGVPWHTCPRTSPRLAKRT